MQVLRFFQDKGLKYKTAAEGGLDRMMLAEAVYDTNLTPVQVINWLKKQRYGYKYQRNPRVLDAQTLRVEERVLARQVVQLRAAAAAQRRQNRNVIMQQRRLHAQTVQQGQQQGRQQGREQVQHLRNKRKHSSATDRTTQGSPTAAASQEGPSKRRQPSANNNTAQVNQQPKKRQPCKGRRSSAVAVVHGY